MHIFSFEIESFKFLACSLVNWALPEIFKVGISLNLSGRPTLELPSLTINTSFLLEEFKGRAETKELHKFCPERRFRGGYPQRKRAV